MSRLTVDADGTIRVPAFDLPISPALSREARESQLAALLHPALQLPDFEGVADEAQYRTRVEQFRQELDAKLLQPFSQALLGAFPVEISSTVLGGVPVETFVPRGVSDDSRVLINLHGGAFLSGAVYGGRVESIPVASLGRIKVVSVDYRQGFEHHYPAATEDVIAVYQELLKVYPRQNIGIYGGSAGGRLTAQALTWMIDKGIPVPGAAAVLSSGGGGAGDSEYFGKFGIGEEPPRAFPPAEVLPAQLRSRELGYFAGVKADDYLVTPSNAPRSVLEQFPPTLIITATRAFDLTPSILFHRALTRAQVDASLHVFEGLGHCFYYNVRLPEAADAYETIIRFFARHLGRSPEPPVTGR